MKKSLILTALLAAIVLWGGVLAGCSDDSSSGSSSSGSKIAADSLPAPVGDNPFSVKNYICMTEATDGSYKYNEYVVIDTNERTITYCDYVTKEINSDSAMIKYTYNGTNKTITAAFYKMPIPSDTDKFTIFFKESFKDIAERGGDTNDAFDDAAEKYDGEWKLVNRNELITWYEDFISKRAYDVGISVYTELYGTNISKTEIEKTIREACDESIAEIKEDFDDLFSIKYTMNYTVDNGIIKFYGIDSKEETETFTPENN